MLVIQLPQTTNTAPVDPNTRAIQAARLDRAADFELILGHHRTAERLAWQAAAIRDAVQ